VVWFTEGVGKEECSGGLASSRNVFSHAETEAISVPEGSEGNFGPEIASEVV
jgi:hypothetical protein